MNVLWKLDQNLGMTHSAEMAYIVSDGSFSDYAINPSNAIVDTTSYEPLFVNGCRQRIHYILSGVFTNSVNLFECSAVHVSTLRMAMISPRDSGLPSQTLPN